MKYLIKIMLFLTVINTYNQDFKLIDTLFIGNNGYGFISEINDHEFDSSVYEINNKMRNGKYEEYSQESGSKKVFLSETGYYINDKRHGLFHSFYSNGSLRYVREFQDGGINGYCIEYYKNGQIKSSTKYLPWPKKYGDYYLWSNEGVLIEMGFYKEGRLIGFYSSFHNNGNTDSTGYFAPVKGEEVTYVEDLETGMITEEIELVSNIPAQDGLWRYYDKEGKLISRKYFDKGKLFKVEILH